jgi:hypothetical protein
MRDFFNIRFFWIGHTACNTDYSLQFSSIAKSQLKSVVYYTRVEEDEVGGPCSTNGGEEERV